MKAILVKNTWITAPLTMSLPPQADVAALFIVDLLPLENHKKYQAAWLYGRWRRLVLPVR